MINDLNEVNWCYLLDPTFELINSAGKPLTDGWIEVYIHGTRSKYYCASDFDGTLHPFKIPLDSLGANIILASPAHAYDVYVYNKYGSLIMSRYNVVPATGDAEVITDTTVITSDDGTVQVSSSDQTNWDLSIADTIAPVTAEVDEHDRQITQIEHDISDINGVLSNKKNKQDPYVAEGGVTKTITRVEQDRNGNLNVTYSDIDLPPEVPTVEITSPNGTLNVASSIDVETNTKTFEIDVKNSDPVWHYWTGNNAWTQIATKSWTQINRPSVGAGSNPHPWNPDMKRGVYDTKAHFTVTFHNYNNSKTVPNQIIQVGFRAKFVGKNDPTAINYVDLGAWTYDPTLYTTEPYQYNFAQESLRQNHDTSNIINVASYWGDTDFNVYFEAALLNTDGSQDVPPIDTVLFAEINYFGYHEVKGAVQSTSGGGREYYEGSGIDITDDTISVNAGEGLTFVQDKLTVDFDEVNAHQVQSDWNQTASAEPDFIKNKPVEKQLVEGRNIHITDTGSAVEISSDSAPQVQSDWTENDTTDPAYIQHKPTEKSLIAGQNVTITDTANGVQIDAAGGTQVQSNWNESDTTSPAYIQNKPNMSDYATDTELSNAVDALEQQIQNIPAQEQANWTESDNTDPSYIKNKPSTCPLVAGQNITITDTGSSVQISATGGSTYTAGTGIDITNDVISANLEAGDGITIVPNNGKAKIINSDNAQALPIVAGSGVKLTVVNDQVVVSADETVLWSNPGPQTNTKDINWSSQSLSESIANFEHVKFIYSTDQSGYAPRELTYTVRSSNDSYVLQDTFASDTMWLLRIALFNLNGTSITNTYNVTRNMRTPTNGGSISCSGESTGYNILYKIVGINRIANN